jgi:Rrf2 family protein
MLFSKTFGYALRSILYIAAKDIVEPKEKVRWIQLEEIAEELKVPRYFLGKVLKRLSKAGILSSQKGPNGGFGTNESTLATSLLQITELTGEAIHSDTCVLQLKKCNARNPCVLHTRALQIRDQWVILLNATTIYNLLYDQKTDFIKVLTASGIQRSA